jgi:hypothetical protein
MLLFYYYMGLMRGYTEMCGGYYEKSDAHFDSQSASLFIYLIFVMLSELRVKPIGSSDS